MEEAITHPALQRIQDAAKKPPSFDGVTSIVLLSGGMDSATALALAKSKQEKCVCLGFNYGQRHVRELLAASAIAAHYESPFYILDTSFLAPLMPGSSQTDPETAVPHGHYAAESMKKTVVPNRNMIMLSIAAGIALANKVGKIWMATHSGDHAIYPDCRPSFVEAFQRAVDTGNWDHVFIKAPFIGIDKAEIVKRGTLLEVPYKKTWSCYEGGELHCGKCGTCVERREAFEKAEAWDPTVYA